MSVFDYVDTALLVIFGLGNLKTRKVVRKELSKIRMYVMAHQHPSQEKNTNV